MIDTSAASRSFYSCCCSRFVVVAVTPTPPPFPVVPIQEATPAAEVDAPATSTDLVVIPSPTITAHLLSAGVTTISAPEMPPPPSSVP